MPHGGTVEDALASAARSYADVIESGHAAEHEQPVGCNRTQAGRDQNRRVEFVIVSQ